MPPELDPSQLRAIELAFFILVILGGNVLIPMMLISIFALRNSYSRSIIFLNFCCAWVFNSVSYLLLFYTGRFHAPEQPDRVLCGLQAILVYVTEVWGASSALALVMQLWFGVRSFNRNLVAGDKGNSDHTRMMLLLFLPLLSVLGFSLCSMLIIQAHPEFVGLTFLYCSINYQPLRTSVATFIAVTIGISIAFQVDTARRFYTRRSATQAIRVQGFVAVSLFVRMMLFITFAILAVIAASFASFNNEQQTFRHMVQGSMPLIAFLIFGTNRSIYQGDYRK